MNDPTPLKQSHRESHRLRDLPLGVFLGVNFETLFRLDLQIALPQKRYGPTPAWRNSLAAVADATTWAGGAPEPS